MSTNDPTQVPGDEPAADTNPVDPAGAPADAPVNPAGATPVVPVDPPFDPPPPDAPVLVSQDAEGNVVEEDAPAPGDEASVPATDPDAPGDATPDDEPDAAFPTDKPIASTNAPVEPGTEGQDVRPETVEGDDPLLSEVASDPTTGEPITSASGATVLPLDPEAEPALDVDPAAEQAPVAVTQAQPDPSGAAALVLDKQVDQPAEQVVPSRSEVAAQQVLDQGTLTPAQPGDAIHPVETLDGHTVDPSGTADDHMPGLFQVPDAGDTSLSTPVSSAVGGIDLRVSPDDRNKGITNVSPEVAEELFQPVVRILAESGVHRDLLHQWVDQGYADLQGQNSSAQTAGDTPPYPNLVF